MYSYGVSSVGYGHRKAFRYADSAIFRRSVKKTQTPAPLSVTKVKKRKKKGRSRTRVAAALSADVSGVDRETVRFGHTESDCVSDEIKSGVTERGGSEKTRSLPSERGERTCERDDLPRPNDGAQLTLLPDSRRIGNVLRSSTCRELDESPLISGSYSLRDECCAAWERALQHAKMRCSQYKETNLFGDVLASECGMFASTGETPPQVIAREVIIMASVGSMACKGAWACGFQAGDVLTRSISKQLNLRNVKHPCVYVGAGIIVDLYQPYDSDTLINLITTTGKSPAFVRAHRFDFEKHSAHASWCKVTEPTLTTMIRFRRCMSALNSVGPCWFHPIQATCWYHLGVWRSGKWQSEEHNIDSVTRC